jgi:hypothetical protein
MAYPSSLRSILLVIIGLVVGGLGVTGFRESLPGAEGSPEERANRLEVELKEVRNRLVAFEAKAVEGGVSGPERQRTLVEGARGIAEKIRAGQVVNPDDIFRASQPLIRELAPLFDQMRLKGEKRMIESKVGELTRKYDLSAETQGALRQWFEVKSSEAAQRWTELVGRDGARLEDIARASQNLRADEGLEKFMEGKLSPENLAGLKAERMVERAGRVQREADLMMSRLDAIVQLSEAQKDGVFSVVARSSKDYDPTMILEGASGEALVQNGAKRREAILAVLNADQRAVYEVERQRRSVKLAEEWRAVGMSPPANGDFFDDENIW